jgi:hypothetical protein
MNDAQLFLVEQFPGVFQEHEAVRALPLRIGVGEMRANVAEPGGSEECIAQSVGQNITIGMADRAFIEWNLDSPDDQLASFGETVEVVANSAADAHAFFSE